MATPNKTGTQYLFPHFGDTLPDPPRTLSHTLTHLECSRCGGRSSPDDLSLPCSCGEPPLARYDLDLAAERLRGLTGPPIVRYAPLLPVRDPSNILTLGEGDAPIIPSRRWGPTRGLPRVEFLWEGSNPTLSFKARGAAVLVSWAKEQGYRRIAAPSAGNAGSAIAAYAAAAGMEARIAFPTWVPRGIKEEARALGAEVIEVDGDLPTTGKVLHEQIRGGDWLDGSTWKTPWRVEGKKTIAFELAERDLPDCIIFPTGGGVGIVALWKGFGEIRRRCPRLVVAQMARCAPIVRAYREGKETVQSWSDPVDTAAHGLNVTAVGGGRMVLQALQETKGTAMDVTEEEVAEQTRALASEEGLWSSPEGAAAAAALLKLVEKGQIDRDERCLVCLTASGLKYSA